MVQHATSEHGLARHQKMVEAESEHGSMEASEEHEIRSTEAQKMVSRNRSTSRSEDQKMLCVVTAKNGIRVATNIFIPSRERNTRKPNSEQKQGLSTIEQGTGVGYARGRC